MTRCAILPAVTIAFAAVATGAAGTCDEWLATFADYDRRVEAIVDGEPEHLLGDLDTVRVRVAERDRTAALRMRARIAARTAALAEVTPPDELDRYHELLVAFHRAGIATADAFLSEEADDDTVALERVHEALLAYFREVEVLLSDHDCPAGDIAAVRDAIAGLERILETDALRPPSE